MTRTTERTVADRLAGITRMIRAIARDPIEWDPEELNLLAGLEVEVARARAKVVYGLRETGATDKQIADALGITQQAVSKRWPGGGRYIGAAGRYRKPRGPQ